VLQAKLMLPMIDEVILVKKSLFEPQVQIFQSNLSGIITKPDPTWLSNPILPAMNGKTVEMVIISTHHDLEGMVQISHRAGTSDQQSPPDGRTDTQQQDVKLVDFTR
jgi:hypothetical protein